MWLPFTSELYTACDQQLLWNRQDNTVSFIELVIGHQYEDWIPSGYQGMAQDTQEDRKLDRGMT